ncbi:uncharacterized protein LOC112177537 [Rosa chinensis]|uniref:uncharacterized protein LOC112177537 n=1 Tax=Rosa chinensis TaxID=74649 RepID=UPI000D0908C9|nr:uncharacterized protein LOC112177537 [Rosa chinensis]
MTSNYPPYYIPNGEKLLPCDPNTSAYSAPSYYLSIQVYAEAGGEEDPRKNKKKEKKEKKEKTHKKKPKKRIDFTIGFYDVFVLLTYLMKYHTKAIRKKKRPLTKWECPPRGRLKINIDGAFRSESGTGGIGVVVRDDLGIGLVVIARPFLQAHSAINMEAEACRDGLLLGIHQGWTNIDIESDSALLIAALKSKEENLSEVSRILDDCRDYMSAFQYVRARHAYREANGVTHRLAHLASLFSINDVWLDETPAIIQDVLY